MDNDFIKANLIFHSRSIHDLQYTPNLNMTEINYWLMKSEPRIDSMILKNQINNFNNTSTFWINKKVKNGLF